MSAAELQQIETTLRREIEALEKERRDGDLAFSNKQQQLGEARERVAAARGDGDRVSLMKEELKAQILAQKRDSLMRLKEQNDELLEQFENALARGKTELQKVKESKHVQQKIYVLLREKGIAEFQAYSPGEVSASEDEGEEGEEDEELQMIKQPSFSANLQVDDDNGDVDNAQHPSVAGYEDEEDAPVPSANEDAPAPVADEQL
ncbi:hypothetical protein GNI_111350 [Gregarina niphandrodes]|uniref:Uncharacterized protein n=1 Tax=Gregarina niphandrodes TaxID=110365 RepID=A0A023B3H1_GRENI|nr:hypothetical protein GNI_111350 [Gregarina niphandrodes]EZG55525.1 hypothetical protein GNI_111350 [Gregarina niphandrodes]|eukprot:XP_011131511.1 hypothetical protein GNI_111350 [Gregarina niphandrodes]